MNDRTLLAQLGATSEDLDRVLVLLPSRLSYLTWMRTGRTGGGDGTGRRRVEHWCDAHERSVEDCHGDGLGCRGVPLDLGGDPTGDSAMIDNRVTRLHDRIQRDALTIIRATERLVLDLLSFEAKLADELEVARAAADSVVACESCLRTTVKGSLRRREPMWKRLEVDGKPTPLCRWCGDFVLKVGELPTTEQLQAHWRGQRVMRSAS